MRILDFSDNGNPVVNLVGMLTKDDHCVAAGGVRGVSLRMAVDQICMVDALAAYAETSRNVILNELVRAGVSAVMPQLPDVVREEILEDSRDRFEQETGQC